jgi:uncharacterized membrane protein YsdA (DUF1294 family)
VTAPVLGFAAAYLLAANLVTFATDKHRARTHGRRTCERTLLWLAAAGGSPAGFIAQQALRHKTRKQPFATWLIVIAGVLLAVFIGLAAAFRP